MSVNINERLRQDEKFMQECASAMNTEVTFKEVTKKLKDFDSNTQYKFLAQASMQKSDLKKKNEAKKVAIRKRFEFSMENGVNTVICEGDRDEALRGLAVELEEFKKIKHLEWSEELIAGLKYLSADHTGSKYNVEEKNINGDYNLKVKFTNCPAVKMSKADKEYAAKYLEDNYGPIIMENIILNKYRKELWVEFLTQEGKDRCMIAGVVPAFGKPITPSASFIDRNFANFSIYLDGIRNDTTEEDIRRAFNAKGSAPSKISVHHPAAYADFEEEEMFFFGLSLRRLEIRNRMINLLPNRNNDPDVKKAILGFWSNGRTTPMKDLYPIIDNHGWKVLVLQPVFWDDGRLKHYYFATFKTVLEKLQAMWNPLSINGEVLQLFEISRDEAGRLEMPMEGEWRKKARSNIAKETQVEDNNKSLAPLTLRSFDLD